MLVRRLATIHPSALPLLQNTPLHLVSRNLLSYDLPAFHSDYTPIGRNEKIGDVHVYVAEGAKPQRGLICNYDIFGLLPNTVQDADLLATKLNARVYVPDFFHGKPWDPEEFPPKDGMEVCQKLLANKS